MKKQKVTKSCDLILDLVRTFVYFRVRKIRLSLAEVGFSLVGSSREKLKENQNRGIIRMGVVLEMMDFLRREGALKLEQAFYWWRGSDGEFEEDIGRQRKIAVLKMRWATKIAKVLKHLPFVRMVAVNGTVGLGCPLEKSDIDFLVVAKHGRIWLVRLFLAAVLELMGQRKRGKKRKDKICLNHFITDENLEMRWEDLYSALEYARMVCVINRNRTWERFLAANSWINKYLLDFKESTEAGLPSYWEEAVMGVDFEKRESWLFLLLDRILSSIWFDWLERLAAKLQRWKIERHKLKPGGQVYWGDDALIFHPRPKSVIFGQLYREKITEEEKLIRDLAEKWNFLKTQA